MQDSSYGTTLFALSGLHGIHVIIGVIFLSISLIRIFYDDITTEHHCGIEFSIYYWHLVDLVWIFLFLIVYWFGS